MPHMSTYVRAYVPGGTFFFTVVTNFRRPILVDSRARAALRHALQKTRLPYPFEILAIVLLPDHLHCIWSLPDGDSDFSNRWRLVKSRFTGSFLHAGGAETNPSRSRRKHAERGIWHRRFWERTVRDEHEFERMCHYIHYNPVKHGLVRCPHDWPYSSFHRFVGDGRYEIDWGCTCNKRTFNAASMDGMSDVVGE